MVAQFWSILSLMTLFRVLEMRKPLQPLSAGYTTSDSNKIHVGTENFL